MFSSWTERLGETVGKQRAARPTRQRQSRRRQARRHSRITAGLENLEPRLLLAFQPLPPMGSLVYGDSLSGSFVAPETDVFAIELDGNQTLAGALRPGDGSIQAKIEVFDPANASLGSFSSAAAGDIAAFDALWLTNSGVYQVAVTNLAGTGPYTLQLALNASGEAERYGGPANDALETAQDLDASGVFVELAGGGQRAAVLGSVQAAGVDLAEGYAAAWSAIASDGAATALHDDRSQVRAGSSSLRLETASGSDVALLYPADRSAAWDLSGGGSIEASYFAVNPNLGFQGEQPWIRLYDGQAYIQLTPDGELLNDARGQWLDLQIPLAGDATWTRTESGSVDMSSIDAIELYADTWDSGFTLWLDRLQLPVVQDPDWYAFSLDAGQVAALAVTGHSAGQWNVQLYDSDQQLLAVGMEGAEVDGSISNFAPLDDGTYYAAVQGQGDYSLLVTRQLDFEREHNSLAADAQPLSAARAVVGSLGRDATGGIAAEDTIRVALLRSSYMSADQQLADDTYFDFDPVLVTASQIDTVAELNQFDVVVIGDQSSRSSLQTVAPALRSWVEAGGGVVGTGWLVYASGQATGAPIADIDAVIPVDTSARYAYHSSATVTIAGGDHPVTAGVGGFVATTESSSADTGATVLATVNGAPAVVVGEPGYGRSVYLGPIYSQSGGSYPALRSGDADLLFEQAVAWAAVGGIDRADNFLFEADAGDVLVLSTATPGGGSGEPLNDLDPLLELYHPSGGLVESNNNDPAGDGRNARIAYTVPAGAQGAYRVRVTPYAGAGDYVLTVEGATGDAAQALLVAEASVADGAVLTSFPTQLRLSFSEPLLLPSVAASDLTVNGTPAGGVAFVDGRTVLFDISAAGTGDGSYAVALPAGAVQSLSGGGNSAFALSFAVDATAPTVTASTLADGAILEPGDLVFTATFDEALDAADLDAGDVRLIEQGFGNEFAADTFDYDAATRSLTVGFQGLQDGTYTLSLLSGPDALHDAAGNPLNGAPSFPLPSGQGDAVPDDFSVSFVIDAAGDEAYPVPLEPKTPAGGLIFDPHVSGTIHQAGDADRYWLTIDAGQRITAVVTPPEGSSLQPVIELLGAGGNSLATISSDAVGQAVALQSVLADIDGVYTLVVSGAAGSTGAYTTRLLLNAAAEDEHLGGPANDELANPQHLDSGSVALGGGADRLAIAGQTGQGALIQVSDIGLDASADLLTEPMKAMTYLADDRFLVTDGDYLFELTTGGTLTQTGVLDDWTGALAFVGEDLYAGYYDELRRIDPLTGSDLATIPLTIDLAEPYLSGVTALSTDPTTGQLWAVVRLSDDRWGPRHLAHVDPASGQVTYVGPLGDRFSSLAFDTAGNLFGATGAGADLPQTLFLIDRASGEPFPILPLSETDGGEALALHPGSGMLYRASGGDWAELVAFQSLALSPVDDSGDVFAFQLEAGQAASLVLAAQSGIMPRLELLDSAGRSLATGLPAANADRYIFDFVAPQADTYRARISSDWAVQYHLVVTRQMGFEIEPNDDPLSARLLGVTGSVLGHVGPFEGNPDDEDHFLLQVQSGAVLTLSTSTPGDGDGEPENTLEPFVELFDPDGSLVAANGGGAADGRNSLIDGYVAATEGTYRVRVTPAAGQGTYTLAVNGATLSESFVVNSVEPADGDALADFPSQYQVAFSEALLLTSVAPEDLQIMRPDGSTVAAGSVTVAAPDRLIFELAGLANGDGLYTLNIAPASLTSVSQKALTGFAASFLVDTTGPMVSASSIAAGESVESGLLVWSVQFNEGLETNVLDAADVILEGDVGARHPDSFQYDSATDTLTVSFANVSEGAYTLTLVSAEEAFRDPLGNLLDGDGDGTGGDPYLLEFLVETTVAELPTPLASLTPEGSLIYQTAQTGTLQTSDDLDAFVIELEGGQVLTMLLTTDPGVSGRLELLDPAGAAVESPATASGPGQAVLLQTLPVSATGLYTVRVSGAGGTGAYTLQVLLNAAVETEAWSGAANDAWDAAQDIDGSAISLQGAAERLAVLGNSGDDDFYAFAVAAGQYAELVLTDQSGGSDLQLELRDPQGQLLSIGAGSNNAASAIRGFVAPAAGAYLARVVGATERSYALVVTRGAAFDLEPNNGYAPFAEDITLAGQVLGHTGRAGGGGDLSQIEAAYVRSTTGRPWGSSTPEAAMNAVFGAGNWDDLRFETADPAELFSDAYAFVYLEGSDFLANELETFLDANLARIEEFVATGRTVLINSAPNEGDGMSYGFGGVSLVYSDSSNTAVAIDPLHAIFQGPFVPVGTSFSGNSFSHSTVAGSDLVQLLRAASGRNILAEKDWGSGLVVFGGMTTTNYHSPQPESTNLLNNIIAYVASAAAPGDYYSFHVNAGDDLLIATGTPGGGPGEFANGMDPRVKLYDPAGVELASDDNGAADGRNSLLAHTAASGGVYTVRIESMSEPGEYTLSVAGATSGLPPLNVEGGNVPDGALLNAYPNSYRLDFSQSLQLTSVQAGKLTVNGVPATSVVVVDADTLEFDIAAADAGDGLYQVRIAAGGLIGLSGQPLQAFSATFDYDATNPRVIASSLAPGATVTPGARVYQVQFSEELAASGLGAEDVTLVESFGGASLTPDAFAYDPGTSTATITYNHLAEGAYTLTLLSSVAAFRDRRDNLLDGSPSWPLPSGDGTPGDAFVLDFIVDRATAEFPVPLAAAAPLGSLIYQGQLEGAFHAAGDADAYTISIEAGQTMTAVLDPIAAGFRGRIELLAPDGSTVLASQTAAADGQTLILQTADLAETGNYALRVTSNAGAGFYGLKLVLNAAVEVEAWGGPSNDDVAGAQDLGSGFVDLGNGFSRAAVLGHDAAPQNVAQGSSVTAVSGTFQGAGLSTLVDGAFLSRGTHWQSGTVWWTGTDAVLEIDLGLPYAITAARLQGDDNDVYRLEYQDASDGSWKTLWTTPNYDARIGAGMITRPDYGFSDAEPWQTLLEPVTAERLRVTAVSGDNAYALSEIQLLGHPAAAVLSDVYAFQLDAGQAATLALAAPTAGSERLELWGDAGQVLAVGLRGWNNVEQAIHAFVAPASGVYYARVQAGGDYSLVITRGGDFALETYFQDFETQPGGEWSTTTRDASVAAFTTFLGRFSNGPGATLTLPTVPGASYTLEFDLMVIDSWDGSGSFGPDYFNVDVAGTRLFHHTFIHTGTNQTYPGAPEIGGANYGWSGWSDAIYRRITVPFVAADFSTAIRFYDGGLQGLSDESWGVDNVRLRPATASEGGEGVQDISASGNVLGYFAGTPAEFQFAAAAGDALQLYTTTPGGGPGEPVNMFDPSIQLFNPAGLLAGGDDDGGPQGDGVNAGIEYTVPAGGDGMYTLRVLGTGSGPYTLRVVGASGQRPTPPEIVLTSPREGAKLAGPPASLDITLSEGIRADSVQTSDLAIDGGATVDDVELVDGRTIRFHLTVPDLDRSFNHSLAAGAFSDLQGETSGGYSGSFAIDKTGPRVIGHSPPQQASAPFSTITFLFDEEVANFTAADVVQFTSPSGSSLLSQITGVSVAGNAATVNFNAQGARGTYSMAIGPEITDLVGNRMNQDGDAVNGEVGDDDYIATVMLESADLRVDSVSAPASGVLGSPVTISWTVANYGTDAAMEAWRDQAWLSADTTLSGDDISLLAAISPPPSTIPLQPGSEHAYTQTAAVTLPLTATLAAGNYYILVKTDALGEQAEDNEDNNVAWTPIELDLPPLPDLIVSGIAAPLEGLSGQAVQYRWTIFNQGDGAASGTWRDRVWLSADPVLGGDQHLGDFSFTGSIPAGGSVERIQSFTLPINMQGDRWFIVQTDVYNQLYEHASENNNTLVDDIPMSVELSPQPNLQVTQVRPPAEAFSSQQTVVEWTVTNSGTGPTSASAWYDQVWLSQDNLLDGADTYLGRALNASYLAAGDSYANSLAVTLPRGIQGDYYFLVRTDAYNHVYEHNREDDNVTSSAAVDIELTPPPDLQVSGVQGPTSALSNDVVLVTWSVVNQGSGRNLETSWADAVYLANAPTRAAATEVFSLGTASQNRVLNSAAGYEGQLQARIPVSIEGPWYFIVVTDVHNQVFEHVFETNNEQVRRNVNGDPAATTIFLTPPDLEVDQLQAPASAEAGHPITFDYQVTNYGLAATPNNSWRDAFYLSLNETIEPGTDVFLGSRSHSGSLQLDESYDATVTVALPEGLVGNYFLLVQTDSDAVVFEGQPGSAGESNNVAATSQPIVVVSHPPDLVIQPGSFAASPAAVAGGLLHASWAVLNQGSGASVGGAWTDSVYISLDNIPGGADDRLLGTFAHSGNLAAGEAYAVADRQLNLPIDLSGTVYVWVRTDASNQVYEGADELNNDSDLLPVAIVQNLADLQVAELAEVAGPLVAGQMVTVNWSVQNEGTGRTNALSWRDRVFLSTDLIFDSSDMELGSYRRSSPLEPGESYAGSGSFQLPLNVSGAFYIGVVTDADGQVFESFEANNTRFRGGGGDPGDPLLIEPPPPGTILVPDLVTASVSAPPDAYSGQAFDVTWTVRNDGDPAGGSWYDQVYLSLDQVYDPAADISLGHRTHSSGLAAGGEYTATQTFSVPRGLAGPFYVFVVADRGGRVSEADELNNIAYDGRSMLVQLAPPADLVLGTISVPSNGSPGAEAAISYTVHNLGDEPAVGSWYDSLYISTDDKWDLQDALFGRIHHVGDVADGASYSHTLTAPLPGVLPGEYHVIVRSDIRNHIPESNEANNLGASLDRMTLDAQILELGVPAGGSLATGQSLYYRVEVPAGETLKVEFDSAAAEAFSELYVSHESVPNRTNFDFASIQPFSPDQRVVIEFTQAGTYYVLVYGNSDGGASGAYTIEASLVDFSVFDTGYGRGGNAGNLTIEINGAKFDRSVTATLSDGSGFELPAVQHYYDSGTQIYATFDLRQVAPGTYDVIVQNSQGGSIVVPDALQVVAATAVPEIVPWVEVPRSVRRNVPYQFTVSWANDTLNDVPAPLLTVGNTGPFGRSPGSYALGTRYTFLGTNTRGGPLGILRPNQSETVTLFGYSDAQPGDYRVFVDRNGKNPAQAFDWVSLRDELQPAGMSEADFAPLFQQIQLQVGPTWGDYLAMLTRNADLVSGPGDPHPALADLLKLEVLRASAELGDAIVGRVSAEGFDVAIDAVPVVATNLTTGETFAASSYRDGSFYLVGLSPGSYQLGLQRGLIPEISPQLIQLDDGQTVRDVRLQASRVVDLLVQVVDSAGNPVAGAEVSLALDGQVLLEMAADERGQIVLAGLPAGDYQVLAEAEGLARTTVDVAVGSLAGSLRVDLQMAVQSSITGSVTAAGQGAVDFAVVAVPVGVAVAKPVHAALDGQQFTVATLAPGTYDLSVFAEGHPPLTIEGVVVPAEGSVDLPPIELPALAAPMPQSLAAAQASIEIPGWFVELVQRLFILYEATYGLGTAWALPSLDLCWAKYQAAPFPAIFWFSFWLEQRWQTLEMVALTTLGDPHVMSMYAQYFDALGPVGGSYSVPSGSGLAWDFGVRSRDGWQQALDEAIKGILKDSSWTREFDCDESYSESYTIDQLVALGSHEGYFREAGSGVYHRPKPPSKGTEFWNYTPVGPAGVAAGGVGGWGRAGSSLPLTADWREINGTVTASLAPGEGIAEVSVEWTFTVSDGVDFEPGATLGPVLYGLKLLENRDLTWDIPFTVNLQADVGPGRFGVRIDPECDPCQQPDPPDDCDDLPRPEPRDPNDILGPQGYGDEQWIVASRPLNYTIRFENDPVFATAPAQVVRITQLLDADLDFRTFRVGDFGFGESFFEVPENRAFYTTRIDLVDTLGIFVDVAAGIDTAAGEAFWQFTTIDPETGDVPVDALTGFLPPNLTSPEGMGFVNYSVRPRADAPTGTRIDALATIIFDTNAPLDTPPIFNTLDKVRPTSQVEALPGVAEASFLVRWTGSDDENGSGLAAFNIYVSVDDQAFEPWLLGTQLTEAQFEGQSGRRYAFFSTAFDNAGNEEAVPAAADAAVAIAAGGVATIGDRVWLDSDQDGVQDQGETGLPGVTVRLYLDGGNVALSEDVTDESGWYQFGNLDSAAAYFLEFALPAGYAFSPQDVGDDASDSDPDAATGRTDAFFVVDGDNFGWDAGLVPLDVTPPSPPENLRIDPDRGLSATDGVTDTGAVTLFGSLGEDGLTVSVFDETTGTDLGAATVTADAFSKSLLLAEGPHELRVRVTDSAGNWSEGFFEVLVDKTRPTSSVQPLETPANSKSFDIVVLGHDVQLSPEASDSGVAWFDVYVSVDQAAFVLWRSLPAESPVGEFKGDSNHTYAFRSIARDRAGNVETKPVGSEAWTHVPDLDPPATQVVDASPDADASVIRLEFSGTDFGGEVAAFRLYVQVDGDANPMQLVGEYAASQVSGGVYGGSAVYADVLTDGQPHSYRFFTVGVDGNGNVELEVFAPDDLIVQAMFDPATSLVVTGFDVQQGAVQRSYIRYVDISFNQGEGIAAIIASLADGQADNDRLRLERRDLNGQNPVAVSLTAEMLAADELDRALEIDFGIEGIGGNRNGLEGNGYYRMSIDADDDLSNGRETDLYFYRLAGDVNHDRRVDSLDLLALNALVAGSSWDVNGDGQIDADDRRDADVNGDGVVDAADRVLVMRGRNKALAPNLHLDD